MADDLFNWLDALWNKKRPEGTFPAWTAHRFLASDPDMARISHEMQLQVRDPQLVFRVWQGYLPKGPKAPRLAYIAAKKAPAEEALVVRMKQTLGERREVVEQMIALVKEAGRVNDLYREYGVKAP